MISSAIFRRFSLFQAPRWWWKVVQKKEMRKTRGGWGETGRRSLYAFFERPVPVYQLLIYPLIGQL